MRLRNHTPIDSVWLARVVNAVSPRDLDDDLIVQFENVPGPCCRGLAWARGTKFSGSVPHAHIYVARAPIFPQYPPALKNRFTSRLGFTLKLESIEEAIVLVTAHELGHLRFGPGERSAHAWGMRMLRRYWRRGLPCPRAWDRPPFPPLIRAQPGLFFASHDSPVHRGSQIASQVTWMSSCKTWCVPRSGSH